MTNVRSLLPSIHIHPILWFFIFLSIITGTFTEIIIIFTIVIIHELGHYSAAKAFQWRIRKISLWIFGGVMETDEYGSKPIKQEMMIIIAGPLQHVWIYGCLFICAELSILPASVIALAMQYNTTILLFNLLPILPLDGGKLLFLLYSCFLPYRQAHSVTIISSILATIISIIVLLSFFSLTLSVYVLLGFILWENRVEWKQRYYVFIRFLLKRHQDKLELQKVRPIVVHSDTALLKVFSQFKRNCRHHIHVNVPNRQPGLLDELDCLQAYFGLKQYQATAGDISGLRK